MARKRRRRDRARRTQHADEPAQPGTAARAGAAPVDERLPSTGARIGGVLVALLTFAIAAGVIVSGLSDDRAAVDVALRLFAGVVLIALGIVISALALVPRLVRRAIWGE